MKTIKAKRLASIVRQFSKAKILIIGDIIMDQFIWGKVTRISPEAPVPVVNINRETLALGGAANVANNLFGLGAKACLAGLVGNDMWGKEIVRILSKNKANSRGLILCKDKSTIVKTRIVAHSQQVVRVDRENNSLPCEKDIKKVYAYIKKTIPYVDGVVIEDYGKGVVVQELVSEIIELCKKHKKPLIVDPKKGHMLDYSGVTVITPNLEEAYSIVGFEYDGEYVPKKLEQAGESIIKKWQVQAVLVTTGEHGMSLFEKNKTKVIIPSTAKEVFDVSGAGDTVVGVLAAALVSGATLHEASFLANIAAGVVVSKLGTAVCTLEELKKAIKLLEK